MKLDSKTWGSVAQWVIAIVAVFGFLLKLYEIFSRTAWSVAAIVIGIIIILVVIPVLKIKKISLLKISLRKSAKFIGWLVLKTSVVSIVALAISFFYRDYLSKAIGEVIKSEGRTIAKETENCVLKGVREDDEKVILTLVDSETVRNVVYRDALNQAKNKGYIDFIRGRYHTPFNWIEVPFTPTEDKNGSGEKLRLTLTEDERRMVGGGEKVLLLLAEVEQLLPDNQIRQILKEIDSEKSVLITEDERKVIEECFNKHKEKDDLYSLMYLVLSDANVITELESKEVYDVEYYELREYRKDVRIAEDAKIVKLLDSAIVIKKTVRHLALYDKLGIIGCYIDELRFQHTKSKNQLPKSSP